MQGDAEEQQAATRPSKPLALPVKAAGARAIEQAPSLDFGPPLALLPLLLHGWARRAADQEDEDDGGE